MALNKHIVRFDRLQGQYSISLVSFLSLVSADAVEQIRRVFGYNLGIILKKNP